KCAISLAGCHQARPAHHPRAPAAFTTILSDSSRRGPRRFPRNARARAARPIQGLPVCTGPDFKIGKEKRKKDGQKISSVTKAIQLLVPASALTEGVFVRANQNMCE